MIKALIVDPTEIYRGEEAFKKGEVVELLASVDNGEGGYVELFSNKLNRPYRIYSGEFDSFEVYR